MRRCLAPSCSARSDPASTSATPAPASVDPVFTIGDLSTVWLVAYVRESEAPKVRAGQQLDFTVLAYPKTTFKANIDHVAASLDPSIRRLMVRATIDNSNGQFKPEMFTSVTIYTDEGDSSIAVPRDAVIYEADNARVWVARADKTIEVRQIKTGITRGGHDPGAAGSAAGRNCCDQRQLVRRPGGRKLTSRGRRAGRRSR